MSSTTYYHLCFLGTPCAERKGEMLPRFARRPTWAMLALLAERSDFVSREELGQFWEDAGGGLRQALHACYKTFGQDAFEKSERAIRLREGVFTTDTKQFLSHVSGAERAEDAEQRIERLHNALALVRGAFLAGCEAGATGWVLMQQAIWQARIAAAGQTLIALLEAQDRPREALEVAERLTALHPDEPDFPQKVLYLTTVTGGAASPPTDCLQDWLAFDENSQARRQAPTPSEQTRLDAVVTAVYTRLTEPERAAARRLSILEGSFDAELAEQLCGLRPAFLTHLRACHLLSAYEERFLMPDAVRRWMRQQLPESARTEQQRRYYRHFVRLIHFIPYPGMLQENRQWGEANQEDFDAAFQWCLDCASGPKPTLDAEQAAFLHYGALRLYPRRLRDAFDALHTAFPNRHIPGLPDTDFFYYAGSLAVELREWRTAAQYLREELKCIHESDPYLSEKRWAANNGVLIALHHAGESEEIAQVLGESWSVICPVELEDRHVTLLNFAAEVFLATGRIAEALEKCEEAIPIARRLPEVFMGSLLYHRGQALYALGRKEEALRAWDEALACAVAQNDRHAHADCLQCIGRAQAEMGMVTHGRLLIEQALALYESIPNVHSRAACLRTLGDALRLKGDIEHARAAYSEGLQFWEEQNHPRWTERFRERLQSLNVSGQSRGM